MRPYRSLYLFAATALVVTLAAQPIVHADTAATASALNLDLSSLDENTLLENYLNLRQQMAADKADAEQMQSLINAGSTSVSQAELTELNGTIAKQEAKARAYETLLAQINNTTADIYKMKEDYIALRQDIAVNKAKLETLKDDVITNPQYDKIKELTAAIQEQEAEALSIQAQIRKMEAYEELNNTPKTTTADSSDDSSDDSSSSNDAFQQALQSGITNGLLQGMLGNMGGLGNMTTMPTVAHLGQTPGLAAFAGKQADTPQQEKEKTEAEKKREELAKKCAPKETVKGTTETSPGKAADDAVGGADAAKTAADAAAKAKEADALPEECSTIKPSEKEPQSKVTGNNTGEFEGQEGNKYGLDTQEKIDQFIADRNGRQIGKNGECASWTRTDIPYSTADWRQGTQVTQENQPKIGTWIATFNNGDKYGTDSAIYGKSGFSHTGMFYGYAANGNLLIADQFKNGALKVREYTCNGGLQSCTSFHTIKTPGNMSNLLNHPFFQKLQMAWHLTKIYSPLLKA